MRKPYMMPVVKASPDIKTREPRISIFTIILLKLLTRFYLFMFYGVARVVLRGGKDIFLAFKRALEGKSRCIVAFRHPNGGEPQLLGWFFLFKLRRLAAKAGIKFNRFPHVIFVYGYEVVRWGGWVARFVMPNVGALPVHHSKFDRHGMSRIHNAIIEGRYPVALAPEGQVSYTTESVPRLEQGVIRIGFSAAENLPEDIPLEILPVAIHFRFGSWGKMTLEWLIRKIEKYTGIDGRKFGYSKRLTACRDYILEKNEERYGIKADKEMTFEKRLDAVINAALLTTEKILCTESKGDTFSRMYTLRQTWWDRVVLPGVDSLKGLTKLEQGIKDLRAGEAWHAGRHLELVDLSLYFRDAVPEDDAPMHNKVEYAQNLWDLANRTMGGAYHTRVSIFPRRVIIQAAPVLNLSERLPDYKKDRKTAIDNALSDLLKSYLSCIDEVNKAD